MATVLGLSCIGCGGASVGDPPVYTSDEKYEIGMWVGISDSYKIYDENGVFTGETHVLTDEEFLEKYDPAYTWHIIGHLQTNKVKYIIGKVDMIESLDSEKLALEIIAEKSIETQEDLADALRLRGFQVTQATVSRDIKELRLVKALAPDGSYRYATAEKGENGLNERLIRMFSETVISMVSAYNQIIVRTLPASANIAAETIDSLQWPEVLGTIAGDNTILMIVRSVEEVRPVMERLNAMIRR